MAEESKTSIKATLLDATINYFVFFVRSIRTVVSECEGSRDTLLPFTL